MKKKVLTFILMLAMLIGALSALHGAAAFAGSGDAGLYEEKVFSTAAIEDNFDGSSVLVVMDKSVGGINKRYKESFFGGFKKECIEDLMPVSGDTRSQAIDENTYRQILKIKLPGDDKANVLNVIRRLERVKGVKYAGPNYYWQAGGAGQSVPDDADRSAQDIIQLAAAHEITTGSRDVQIGIIDTGIQVFPGYEAELVQNLIYNEDNQIVGRDFFNKQENTYELEGGIYDEDGHGTRVALAAGGALSGVCPQVTLVPLKIAEEDQDDPAMENVIKAIRCAIYNNIPVLNHSWQNYQYDFCFEAALDNYPGLYVGIAGNALDGVGKSIDGGSFYFKKNNRITVGATDYDDKRAVYSNYGAKAVDIYAPPDYPGTSFAAPKVAGTAALIKSKYPNLSAASIREAIISGAEDIHITVPGNFPNPTSVQRVKRLNVYKALLYAGQMTYYTTNKLIDGTLEINGVDNPANELIIPSEIYGIPVTSIKSDAFAGITGLSKITIPDSVANIGINAFSGCVNLTVIMQSEIPPSQNNSFGGVRAIIVPIGSLYAYQKGWPVFANIIICDSQSFAFADSDVCVRKEALLDPGQFIEYTVIFADSGPKNLNFQGSAMIYLEIYTMDGTAIGDRHTGHPYGSASLTVSSAQTPYRIRLWFYSPSATGEVSLMIRSAPSQQYSDYDVFEIWDDFGLYITPPLWFLCVSVTGGYYTLEAFMRSSGSVSVYIYDPNAGEMVLVYKFEDYYISENIHMQVGVYYMVQLDSDNQEGAMEFYING